MGISCISMRSYRSGHYYQRQLTDYREKITINYYFPLLGFLSSPYFIHDASCVMLNTDWAPLPIVPVGPKRSMLISDLLDRQPRIYFRGCWGTTQHSLYGRSPKGRGGVGFLGRTRRAPSPPARGLRECCKLPQWGPGRSPGRNRFRCISKLVEGIKSKRCVKFRGCSNTQNIP